MAADRQTAREAAEQPGAGELQPSSDTPSAAQRTTATQLAEWPIGGTDEPSHELDHLICEIDEVFGFTRADPPTAPSVARRPGAPRHWQIQPL